MHDKTSVVMGVIWSCVFSLLCSPNSKMDKVKHNRLDS